MNKKWKPSLRRRGRELRSQPLLVGEDDIEHQNGGAGKTRKWLITSPYPPVPPCYKFFLQNSACSFPYRYNCPKRGFPDNFPSHHAFLKPKATFFFVPLVISQVYKMASQPLIVLLFCLQWLWKQRSWTGALPFLPLPFPLTYHEWLLFMWH